MTNEEYPITPAVRVLRAKKIAFIPYLYRYEEHGGTHQFAEEFHISDHHVIKTLVFETDQKKPLIILMHGDREVSTKQMARIIKVKQVVPCDAATAQHHTGYQFGGTSPFGTRRQLPVYAEKTILHLQKIYINGGKRGFIVEITPSDLRAVIEIIEVEAAILPNS
ncbi:MAG: Cys-tRNA(Pro) deacylase [Ignavibacteriae bacterium]|nr:MAG: Cys-tRNA(Pro) deacylase [Ignavibacteriota bacterium]